MNNSKFECTKWFLSLKQYGPCQLTLFFCYSKPKTRTKNRRINGPKCQRFIGFPIPTSPKKLDLKTNRALVFEKKGVEGMEEGEEGGECIDGKEE